MIKKILFIVSVLVIMLFGIFHSRKHESIEIPQNETTTNWTWTVNEIESLKIKVEELNQRLNFMSKIL